MGSTFELCCDSKKRAWPGKRVGVEVAEHGHLRHGSAAIHQWLAHHLRVGLDHRGAPNSPAGAPLLNASMWPLATVMYTTQQA
jgi:hypothetical protein